jgi:hypothetical protein
MSMGVFTQTNSYGHLMISIGAALTLSAFLFMDNKHFAEVILVAGEVLFWGGIAITATFGGTLEKERLRTSSWKEILLGRVPEHLQMRKVSERAQVVQALLISLLFALIFYIGNRQQEALSFLVIAIVFAAYLGSLGVTH